MKKAYSINCETETMDKIDSVALQNNTSRSSIIRLLLGLVDYIPPAALKTISPLPGILNLNQKIKRS